MDLPRECERPRTTEYRGKMGLNGTSKPPKAQEEAPERNTGAQSGKACHGFRSAGAEEGVVSPLFLLALEKRHHETHQQGHTKNQRILAERKKRPGS